MNDNYKYGTMDGWHGDEHLVDDDFIPFDDDYYDENDDDGE